MWKKILAFFLLLLLSVVQVKAEDCDNLSSKERVDCYDAKVKQLEAQGDTLASTIAYLNSKMALTEAQINQTEAELKKLEEEISLLSVKIVRLDENLTNISKLLVSRIGASYKRSLFKPIYMVFATGGLSDFFERNKYLQSIQENDRTLLLEMQNSKNQHEQQKKIEEEKQAQAENLKKKLAEQNMALINQRQSKEELLKITKNDEKNYQNLLAAALSEQASIREALAALPVTKFTGTVIKGQIIGVQGSTGRSEGAHLHFGVYHSPYTWYVDSENPIDQIHNGFLEWPIGPYDSGRCYQRIDDRCLSQPWGVSEISKAVGWYPNDFHDAIDVYAAPGSFIKAAAAGEIVYGIDGWGGKYALIKHSNNIVTTYWHLQ